VGKGVSRKEKYSTNDDSDLGRGRRLKGVLGTVGHRVSMIGARNPSTRAWKKDNTPITGATSISVRGDDHACMSFLKFWPYIIWQLRLPELFKFQARSR